MEDVVDTHYTLTIYFLLTEQIPLSQHIHASSLRQGHPPPMDLSAMLDATLTRTPTLCLLFVFSTFHPNFRFEEGQIGDKDILAVWKIVQGLGDRQCLFPIVELKDRAGVWDNELTIDLSKSHREKRSRVAMTIGYCTNTVSPCQWYQHFFCSCGREDARRSNVSIT